MCTLFSFYIYSKFQGAKIQKKTNITAFFLRKFTFRVFLMDISCYFRDFYYFCTLNITFS